MHKVSFNNFLFSQVELGGLDTQIANRMTVKKPYTHSKNNKLLN